MPLPHLPLEIWMEICQQFGHMTLKDRDEVKALKALRLVNKQTREAAETQFFRCLPPYLPVCAPDWPSYYQKVASNPSYARHIRHISINELVTSQADWNPAQVSIVWEALTHFEGASSLELNLTRVQDPVQLSRLCFNILKSKVILPRLSSLKLVAVTEELLKPFLITDPNALDHRFPRLRHLSLISGSGDTDQEQMQLLDSATSISSLNVQSALAGVGRDLCPAVTLKTNFKHQNLRHLTIDLLNVPASGLCALIENSKDTLTTICLSLVWLTSGTWDEVFRALLETTTLRSLDLSCLSYCRTLPHGSWKSPWECRPTKELMRTFSYATLGSTHWIDYNVLRDLYHHVLSYPGDIYTAQFNIEELEKTLNLPSAEHIENSFLRPKAFRDVKTEESFKVNYRMLFTNMYVASSAFECKKTYDLDNNNDTKERNGGYTHATL